MVINISPISFDEWVELANKYYEPTTSYYSHLNGSPHSDDEKIIMSKSRNKTGIYRVSKKKDKSLKQGFRWSYQYYDDDKHLWKFESVDLTKVRKKVERQGLPWIILDEDKARQSYELNREYFPKSPPFTPDD